MQSDESSSTPSARDRFGDKVARGIFQPVARHLRDDLREDRLAEAIALTFEMFLRYDERGVVIDDALLVHACRLRAIDLGRRLAGAGGGHPKADAFDDRNQRDGKVALLSLAADPAESDGGVGYATPMTVNPAPAILSAIALRRWLSILPSRDRDVLALRAAGHTYAEIGLELATSTSWVCARLHALGRELCERMGRSAP